MTVAMPPAFPGSRSLGAWWRQLTPFHPRSLWVAHLHLQRVEALVRSNRGTRPDRLARLVLDALALQPTCTEERLDAYLHLGRPFLRYLLRQMEATGLVQADASDGWTISERGQQAREHGEYVAPVQERRGFYFLDNGQPAGAPEFLNLHPSAALAPAAESQSFAIEHLTQCPRQSADWKRRRGFPPEVVEILLPTAAPDEQANAAAEWQRVILVRPVHLLAAVIRVRSEQGQERLQGFAVQPKGWHLDTAAPAFQLDPAHSSLAAAFNDPERETWRSVWRSWSQAHGLTPEEADACPLERRDHRLMATAPRPLLDRLRTSRGEVLKGESWVLAGEGAIRAAGLLEFVAGGGKR